MMFAGTSGVDSQMDMMHPMVTDFGAFLLARQTINDDDRVCASHLNCNAILPTLFTSVVFFC